MARRNRALRCSFCGQGEAEVSKLLAGPKVHICGHCVGLCNDILEAEGTEELAPDAPEVAFVQGLAHYDLAELEEARNSFRKAATSSDHALADDALYSLGTCDHVEALQNAEDPQESLGKLESAMRHYRNVLLNQPEHEAARDANFKAASMWRQLKQQQQQQQEGDEGREQPVASSSAARGGPRMALAIS